MSTDNIHTSLESASRLLPKKNVTFLIYSSTARVIFMCNEFLFFHVAGIIFQLFRRTSAKFIRILPLVHLLRGVVFRFRFRKQCFCLRCFCFGVRVCELFASRLYLHSSSYQLGSAPKIHQTCP